MVREDILGGLRAALQRGESLRQAMLTFFNAGYIKEEIEEAAREFETEKTLQPQQAQPVLFIPQEVASRTDEMTQAPSVQKVSAYGEKPIRTVPVIQQPIIMAPQRVSGYGEVGKPRGKAVVFILVALLLILLGILAALFFFKDEIMGFFNAG